MSIITTFAQQLQEQESNLREALSTERGDWVVKGFIDVHQNIYTISVDTKVVSKIIELLLLPVMFQFAENHGYQIVLSEHQNHYPDIIFIAGDTKIALDFKSTYRVNQNSVMWIHTQRKHKHTLSSRLFRIVICPNIPSGVIA